MFNKEPKVPNANDPGHFPMLKKDVSGSDSALNIVVTHGWATDSVFTQEFKHLFPEYHLTLIDLPGYGNNSTLEDYAYDFTKTAQILNKSLPQNCLLISWSLSTLYGIKACCLPNSRVKALITVCGAPRFPDEPDNIGFHKRYIDKLSKYFDEKSFKRLLKLFYSIQGNSACGNLITSYFQQFTIPSYKVLDAGLNHMMHVDEREDLKALRQPSLHIFGSKDLLVPVQQIHNIEKLGKRGVIIEGASHLPFLSHPDIFKKIINNFICDHNLV